MHQKSVQVSVDCEASVSYHGWRQSGASVSLPGSRSLDTSHRYWDLKDKDGDKDVIDGIYFNSIGGHFSWPMFNPWSLCHDIRIIMDSDAPVRNVHHFNRHRAGDELTPTRVLHVVDTHFHKCGHGCVLPLAQVAQTAAKNLIWRVNGKNDIVKLNSSVAWSGARRSNAIWPQSSGYLWCSLCLGPPDRWVDASRTSWASAGFFSGLMSPYWQRSSSQLKAATQKKKRGLCVHSSRL